MLRLSDVLIAYPEIDNFEQLETKIHYLAQNTNERFFKMDVKPQFNDTPEYWEDRLESAFY